MFLRCLRFVAFAALVAGPAKGEEPACCATGSATAAAEPRVIRISADPNNLPFSNDRGEGFENKLAELVAANLGARIEYSWRAQRRGFFREALKENKADLVMGVPAHFEMALPTQAYYRSSYVF